MLDWMVWTTPVAIFFVCVAVLLVAMTFAEVRWPTVMRKGFLPMPTTRGDRLFVGLLTMGFVNLAWIGLGEKLQALLSLPEEPAPWIGFALSCIVLLVIMRRG